jgi:hypothetical protein
MNYGWVTRLRSNLSQGGRVWGRDQDAWQFSVCASRCLALTGHPVKQGFQAGDQSDLLQSSASSATVRSV